MRLLFGNAWNGLLVAMLAVNAAVAGDSSICTRQRVSDYFATYGARDYSVDADGFYAAIREHYDVYDREGRHYAGTDAILDYWNNDPKLIDQRWLAYILATSYHETASRMTPVRETLASTDERVIAILRADYRKHPDRYANAYWEPSEETGHSYFGRGYVQLTHAFNYKSADEQLGVNDRSKSYYWNPQLALTPEASVLITYDGMIYGWYTNGRYCLLRHFRPNERGEWRDARRMINGMNKADEIAEHAHHFLEAIEAAKVDRAPASAAVLVADGPSGVDGGDAAVTDAVDVVAAAVDAGDVAEDASKVLSAQTRADQAPRTTNASLTLASAESASRGPIGRAPPPVFSSLAAALLERDDAAARERAEARGRRIWPAFRGFAVEFWDLAVALWQALFALGQLVWLLVLMIAEGLYAVLSWGAERIREYIESNQSNGAAASDA